MQYPSGSTHRASPQRAGSPASRLFPSSVAGAAFLLAVTACSAPPRRLAVAGEDGTVLVYHADLRVADTLTVSGGELLGGWLGADGSTIYLAQRTANAGSLARARRTDGVMLDRLDFYRGVPGLVRVLPDGRTVIAVTGDSAPNTPAPSTLHFLGPDLATLAEPVLVCDGAARGVTTEKTTDRLFVLCNGDVVSEIDRKLRRFVRRVSVPGDSLSPRCDATDIAVSSTGAIVFVLCGNSGELRYVDRLTFTLLSSLDVGDTGTSMARSPDGRYMLIIRPAAHEVVITDVRRRTVLARIETSGTPVTTTVGTDSRTAYVVIHPFEGAAARVLKIDIHDLRVVGEASAPHAPRSVSVWPGADSPVMRWKRTRG
jgi:DNA-binding beta-propeller fold protein YncE